MGPRPVGSLLLIQDGCDGDILMSARIPPFDGFRVDTEGFRVY